jgi:hypothetical protein
MLNVVMLSTVILNVVMLSVIMLNVVMLNVIMLSVVVPLIIGDAKTWSVILISLESSSTIVMCFNNRVHSFL